MKEMFEFNLIQQKLFNPTLLGGVIMSPLKHLCSFLAFHIDLREWLSDILIVTMGVLDL